MFAVVDSRESDIPDIYVFNTDEEAYTFKGWLISADPVDDGSLEFWDSVEVDIQPVLAAPIGWRHNE